MAATNARSSTVRDPKDERLKRFEDKTEWPLLVLALAVVPLIVVPLGGGDVRKAVDLTLVAITVVFALELGYRTYLSGQGVRYLVRNWPDVLIVAVSIVASIPSVSKTVGLARSARALRVLRLTRAAPFLVRASRDVVALLERRGLVYVLVAFLVAIFASAGVIVLLEQRADASTIHNYGNGLYWAFGTTTTVGGTGTPETSEGKALAVLVMFVGITFAAWFTANVAAFLVEHGGVSSSGATIDEVMRKLEHMEAEHKSQHAAQDANLID